MPVAASAQHNRDDYLSIFYRLQASYNELWHDSEDCSNTPQG